MLSADNSNKPIIRCSYSTSVLYSQAGKLGISLYYSCSLYLRNLNGRMTCKSFLYPITIKPLREASGISAFGQEPYEMDISDALGTVRQALYTQCVFFWSVHTPLSGLEGIMCSSPSSAQPFEQCQLTFSGITTHFLASAKMCSFLP